MATDQEVIRNDRNKGITKRYVIRLDPFTVNDNFVQIIKGDRQGDIWIGGGGGLNLWNKEKENFIKYKNDPKNNSSLSSNNVITIHEDREGNLWIGTWRGLNLLNRKTGSFTQYFINPNDTSSWGQNFISAILQDRTGKLWIGCWEGGGVNLVNRVNNTFKNYLKGINVTSIYEDRDGVVWLGGHDDGLYKYDRSSDNFIRYDDSISFTGISGVKSIVEDNQKYLWLGTSDGIVRLNPQRNETRIYSKNYGVGENGLIFSSSYIGRKGELFFGDATGYFSFYPNELTQNIKPPEIIFTGFRLADQIVKHGNNGPLKESLSQVKKIRLRYNQNVFSFDFTAIDYSNPGENRYLFMLENYDNNWHQGGSERKAYYFNIPPGKYVFRVKAANSNGAWAEKKIDIIITPPWWRTWWAYCIYGLLFAFAVFATHRFQKQRIVLAERQRTQKRELAHAKEIEKAYAELKATQAQLIQSEKMASLGELTAGIAHEIQNPLNFVNNFSEVNKELLDEMENELNAGNNGEAILIAKDIKENEEKIIHHGKRADARVKGMLQHSRSSSGIKEPTDINALADEYLRLSYHGFRAKDKTFNATIQTDFDQSLEKINIIPQDIGRVLLNLYNNAFYSVSEKKKLQPDNYKPTVSVSTKKIDARPDDPVGRGKVEIHVRDNGMGIPQKVLDKIYQPFFTTKPTGQGTGLGLSLSYDIINVHGGEIKVETKEGEGAEFIIQLPSN
jgi:signal transduction histidine kinase/streptogramin lyase